MPRHYGLIIEPLVIGKDWVAGTDLSTRNLCSQAFLNIPPLSKPISKSPRWQSQFFFPSIKSLRFTLKSNETIARSVPGLLSPCSPLTIFKKVMSVSINTFKCGVFLSKFFNMVQIRFIHIISKFVKRPPQKSNTSTTIISKLNVMWILATTFGAQIASIKSQSMFRAGKSVGFVYSFSCTH